MGFKDFLRDMKVFLSYVISRPFIEIGNMFRMLYRGAGTLDQPYFWVKFFSAFTVFLILVGLSTNHWAPAYVAAGVTFIALLRFEWIRGNFRKWHMDRIKKRALRKARREEQNGTN